MRIYLDLETRCDLDLKKVGAYKYASDPSCGINCAAVDDDARGSAVYEYEQVSLLRSHIERWVARPSLKFVFHNALFEMTILKLVLGIDIPPSRVIDTMAKCGYYGYPRSLDEAAKALQCSKLKDIGAGSAAMRTLCTGRYTPDEKPDLFDQLYRYCANDVDVMREIDEKLPDLPPQVQALWELDVEINMRGLPIDVKAVENAVYLKEQLLQDANRRLVALTDGKIDSINQTDRMQDFALEHGVEMGGGDVYAVERTLAKQIPDPVRQVLTIRQESGLSSVGKYDAMLRRQVDGRLYHEFDTYGCDTGRPKGSGVQTLNLVKGDDPGYWADLICDAPQLVLGISAHPYERLSEGVRGMICAPKGKRLLGLDLSRIEVCCTALAAQDPDLLAMLAPGRDIYCDYGAKLWGHPITKKEHPFKRDCSKASVLGNGFGGGIGAGQRTAKKARLDLNILADVILPTASPQELEKADYCFKYYLSSKPDIPLPERQAVAWDVMKQRYRKDFPRLVQYWQELMTGFVSGGQAGPVHFRVDPSGLRILTLPSERQLFYHSAHISKRPVRDENEDADEHEDTRPQWVAYCRGKRKKIWHGLLMENVAQAMNHDISTWYMRQANRDIAPVIHQCYDEFTMEIAEGEADRIKAQLKELFATKPSWAAALPVAYEAWDSKRYGK
jgi:DNA polymerase